MTRRSHKGIALTEGSPEAKALDAGTRRSAHPVVVAAVGHPSGPFCGTCHERVTYRRRTYGPHGRAGGWTHIGDGLAQYRSW
jgi:hypothetical protein